MCSDHEEISRLPESVRHQAIVLKRDITAFGESIFKLERDLEGMRSFAVRARQRNWVALALAVGCTALAWIVEGSDWLKWYALPCVLLLGAVSSLITWSLERWMAGRVVSLRRELHAAEQAWLVVVSDAALCGVGAGEVASIGTALES
jgi:hypothetical protein